MVCWRAKDLRQLLSIVPQKALVVRLPQLVRSLLPTLPFLMGKSHDKVMEPNVKIQTLTSALRLLALIRLMFDIFSVSEARFDLERKYLCFERTTSTINSVVPQSSPFEDVSSPSAPPIRILSLLVPEKTHTD